ncbi:MAG: zinc ribbon domain-containing protein [Thermoproteota archaeon]
MYWKLSADDAEQILKEADNARYIMQVGLTESTVPGHLILTNLRIAFLEGLKRKKSLLRIIGKKENLRPVINFSIARLVRSKVVVRQKIRQNQPRSVNEIQQLLVIDLNTPTGLESFTFEVDDPETWANVINMLVPTNKKSIPNSKQEIPPPSLTQHKPARKSRERMSKQNQKVVIDIGDVKFCPECGKELEISAKFCWECGSPQPEIE